MWITGLLGMILKFVECTLSTKYRKINSDGTVSGGPMYYMEIGLKNMLGPDMRITKVRGQWLDWEGRMAMPVFHPSALLRNPALKRDTWEDFKKIVFKYRELIDSEHFSNHV